MRLHLSLALWLLAVLGPQQPAPAAPASPVPPTRPLTRWASQVTPDRVLGQFIDVGLVDVIEPAAAR